MHFNQCLLLPLVSNQELFIECEPKQPTVSGTVPLCDITEGDDNTFFQVGCWLECTVWTVWFLCFSINGLGDRCAGQATKVSQARRGRLHRCKECPPSYMLRNSYTVAVKVKANPCMRPLCSNHNNTHTYTQTNLVHELQVGEEGDVLGPLHSTEEQPGGQLADVLDAHQVVSLHALGAVAGRGVGLGPQQQGDEAGQVRLAVVRVGAVAHVLSRAALRVGRASSLYS